MATESQRSNFSDPYASIQNGINKIRERNTDQVKRAFAAGEGDAHKSIKRLEKEYDGLLKKQKLEMQGLCDEVNGNVQQANEEIAQILKKMNDVVTAMLEEEKKLVGNVDASSSGLSHKLDGMIGDLEDLYEADMRIPDGTKEEANDVGSEELSPTDTEDEASPTRTNHKNARNGRRK